MTLWRVAVEPIYSAAQVAEKIGVSRQRVTQCARRWGIGRQLAREWVFCAADVEAIRDRQGMVGGAGHAKAAMQAIQAVKGEAPSAESVARIISSRDSLEDE